MHIAAASSFLHISTLPRLRDTLLSVLPACLTGVTGTRDIDDSDTRGDCKMKPQMRPESARGASRVLLRAQGTALHEAFAVLAASIKCVVCRLPHSPPRTNSPFTRVLRMSTASRARFWAFVLAASQTLAAAAFDISRYDNVGGLLCLVISLADNDRRLGGGVRYLEI